MIARLGRLPRNGDVVDVAGNRLAVSAMDGRRIARVLVALAPVVEADPSE